MIIRQPPPDVENDAQAVDQPAQGQKNKTRGREAGENLPAGQQAQPAHAQINGQRQTLETVHEKAFQNHTGGGQSPDCPKNNPSHRAAQAHQHERRVRARDEQKNSAIIDI